MLLRVGAEAGRRPFGDDLDDTAERVAVLAGGVGRVLPAGLGRLSADLDRPSLDRDADLREQRLGDRAGGDVHRGLARARPLERVANVVVAELERAGEIGVTWTRERDSGRALAGCLALGRPGAHPPGPVLVVAVPDDERERRAEREAVPEPGQHLDLVLLHLLAWAPPIAFAPAAEVGVDRRPVEREAGREPGDDRDERRPVRLTGGDETERHGGKPSAARIAPTGALLSGPELERGRALRDEDLEPVHDRRSGGAGRKRGRGLRVRQVDERLARPELDEHLVASRGGVDDEVGVGDLGRPSAAAGELSRVRERLQEGDRGAAVAEDDRALGDCEAGEDRGVGRPALDDAVTHDERVHRRRVRLAELGHRDLVRSGHVRACEAERGEPADGLREPLGRRRQRDVCPVEPEPPRTRRSASGGESECSTGQPRIPTSRVVPEISIARASIAVSAGACRSVPDTRSEPTSNDPQGHPRCPVVTLSRIRSRVGAGSVASLEQQARRPCARRPRTSHLPAGHTGRRVSSRRSRTRATSGRTRRGSP